MPNDTEYLGLYVLPENFPKCSGILFLPLGLLMAACKYPTVKDCHMLFTAVCGAGLTFTVTTNLRQLKTVNMLLILKRTKYA